MILYVHLFIEQSGPLLYQHICQSPSCQSAGTHVHKQVQTPTVSESQYCSGKYCYWKYMLVLLCYNKVKNTTTKKPQSTVKWAMHIGFVMCCYSTLKGVVLRYCSVAKHRDIVLNAFVFSLHPSHRCVPVHYFPFHNLFKCSPPSKYFRNNNRAINWRQTRHEKTLGFLSNQITWLHSAAQVLYGDVDPLHPDVSENMFVCNWNTNRAIITGDELR